MVLEMSYKVKVTVKKSKLNSLQRGLKLLNNKGTVYGMVDNSEHKSIPAGRTEGRLSNATLMAMHEFADPSKVNYQPRPAFTNAIKADKDNLQKVTEDSITQYLHQYANGRNGSVDKALTPFSIEGAKFTKQALKSGTLGLAKLSTYTIMRRRLNGVTSVNPLVETEQLVNAIKVKKPSEGGSDY